ncbi:unnamed protein product [Mytilus coruscus]|uniref:B box-type domain-containing protein n=1 Tax=Mytilus coruscus TaxID=42192 RepID=A0A6J8BML0_MYTCO|nr:unnamed protein product [Mytilus coruscus]
MIHVADAVRDGFKKISITTVDTDVIVIAISVFKDTEAEEIWLAFATGKHFHYIPIHDIEQSLVLFNLGFYQYSKPLQVATLYLHLQDEERKQHGYMECFPRETIVIIIIMATAQPSCDICLNLHVTKSACVWCSECEEAICEDCVQRHRIQKATKNHKTILIEDYQQLPISILNIKLECGDHNQKLDFYCSNHNEPCCTRCVSENHKDCRDLKPLPEVVEGVKSSAAFSDLEDRVKDLSQVIGQTIQEKLNIKSELEVQRNSIISEVEGARKAINIHLDKIQDELLNNLTTNEAQQRDNIDRLIGKLSKMQNSVNEIVYAVEKTKQHASNFQTFLGVNKWIIEIENHESEWKSAQSDQSMATVHLQMRRC